jgi:hypothetical protein
MQELMTTFNCFGFVSRGAARPRFHGNNAALVQMKWLCQTIQSVGLGVVLSICLCAVILRIMLTAERHPP